MFKHLTQSRVKRCLTFASLGLAALATSVSAQTTLTSNSTGNQGGHYYTFWKDSGDASMTLYDGGRYGSQWGNSTNNWVGGKGWNPGGRKTVNYEGYYGVSNSQNSYLALYGWTTNPLIEYYVIESYGSYNPSSCNGGQDMGSFNSDGATYNVRRCQRVNQPSIEGTATFYQYFSVRSPKKGFGNISGTITVGNHFDYWASQGLNLGSHNYMVMATEGYQSQGSSDISVSEGAGSGSSSSGGSSGGSTSSGSSSSGGPSGSDIIVRARGTVGDESITLSIGGNGVATWTLSTNAQNYTYSGNAAGDVQVEFTNDGGDRDVILDYVYVNGETRQAEDMEYNTATYGNGECGGGEFSETMHCNGVIGFGDTSDCFSGSCNAGSTSSSGGTSSGTTSTSSSSGGNTSSSSSSGGNTSSSGGSAGNIVVRARGTNGDEIINLNIGGNTVATWTMATSDQNYNYNGNASGDVDVEFTNDASGRDVILDYVIVNGETRQAEDMEYNTATYGNGSCGGGEYSETMHCSGVIGFGHTDECYSCGSSSGGTTSSTSSSGNTSSSGGSASCSGYVGITFDDGPGSSTSTLISQLEQHGLTPVTWFVQGQYVNNNASQVQQLLSVGEVQNHSWDHPDMTNYSYSQVVDQISRTSQAIQNAGAPAPTLYRPPYGNNTSTIRQAAQDQGLRFITWDVDSRDWDGASSSQIANAANQLQNGQVILMHDASYQNNTINAISQIASNLRSRGLCAGRIDPNTGRAVAPNGGSSSSSSGGTTSSTSSSGGSGSSSSSSGGSSSGSQCNWWGSIYPLCQNQNSGWGWENNQSCIGAQTCSSQNGGGGII